MATPAEALVYYRKVLEICPKLIAAQHGAYLALSRIVPEWHVPMMNEQHRNQAYFDALKAAITPDSKVFEIGTGSGLLAMMAAKLGVKSVVTCEAVPLIAETAQRIVAYNKFEITIKVIAKKSVDVTMGEDMPEQADILVSVIFSIELLGDYVLPSLEDAKRRLLKPHGRVILAAGSIMIALFTGDVIRRNLMVDDSFGFNLQGFNSVVSNKRMIAPIKTAGRCYGIVQWMRLQMHKDNVFQNHPSHKTQVSNWQQCAYLLDAPIVVKVGQVAVVSAKHDRAVPWFFLDKIETK
jgi:precorrin-6B methylase 2